jgi:hypothetical protein
MSAQAPKRGGYDPYSGCQRLARADLAAAMFAVADRREIGMERRPVERLANARGETTRDEPHADAIHRRRQRILKRHHEAAQDQCRLEPETCREWRDGAARHEPDQDCCRQRHDGLGHGQAALQQDHEQEHAAAALCERLESIMQAQQVDVAV